jgi:2-polyprenyl-3-methyl-5-hydroxy-6-metoxy-1,4-benzoquinol methylase
VRGVEFSKTHAAQARERLGLDVWEGDFLAAPLDDAAFDVVTMWDFLEHVLDPRAVLAKCHRLLARGGVALVFTIDTTSLFNEAGALLHRLSGGGAVRVLELLYDYRHNYYFTKPSLTRLLETSGFRIERWRADRAHLGRWLAEPVPWYVFAGGLALDLVSFVVGRPYRRTAFCRRLDD